MSMCFYDQGVLYADRFQISDYRNYTPSLTDNKIFVTPNGRVVVAIMGRVPSDMDDFYKRLENINAVLTSDFNKKVPTEELVLRKNSLIKNLDLDLMIANYMTDDGWICDTSFMSGSERFVIVIPVASTRGFYTATNIESLLKAGMKPAQIFKGMNLFKGTVSKEFTAYDLRKRCFIQPT